MSNILSEISLLDTIYKLKDDNAVTQEQLEEALGNIDMSEVETHIADKNNPHEVTAEQIGAVTKEYVDNAIFGNIVDITLLATNWIGSESPYTYTLAINGVTETSSQEVLPALNITKTQLEVLQAANIQDGGQTAGSLTLKAFGEIPVIDIPIRVLIRGGN